VLRIEGGIKARDNKMMWDKLKLFWGLSSENNSELLR
jgi:hypothetical protein